METEGRYLICWELSWGRDPLAEGLFLPPAGVVQAFLFLGPWGPHRVAVAEFVVIPGNKLEKAVVEGSASSSIKSRRVGVSVKSQEMTWSSVEPRMSFRGPSNACFTSLMSSYLAAFSRRQVGSTAHALGVGTGSPCQ